MGDYHNDTLSNFYGIQVLLYLGSHFNALSTQYRVPFPDRSPEVVEEATDRIVFEKDRGLLNGLFGFASYLHIKHIDIHTWVEEATGRKFPKFDGASAGTIWANNPLDAPSGMQQHGHLYEIGWY